MRQPYEGLRGELLRLKDALTLESTEQLKPFSDAQCYCFMEGSSRELFGTFDVDLVAVQLRVIGELERHAEADLSDRGGEHRRELAMLRLCTEARLEAFREVSTWQLRQLQTVARLRAFYKP